NPLLGNTDVISLILDTAEQGDYLLEVGHGHVLVISYKNRHAFDIFVSSDLKEIFSTNGLRAIRPDFPKVLRRFNAIILHCAGILDRESNGLVFVAKSGGGKSTVTRLCKER